MIDCACLFKFVHVFPCISLAQLISCSVHWSDFDLHQKHDTCSTSSGLPETDKTDNRSSSRALLSHSRDNSFRGHHRPETSHTPSTFPSNTQPFSRTLLPLRTRHPQQPTSLIFTFISASRTPLIHRVSYAVRSSHVLNVATVLVPAQTVIDDSKNRSQ